jgi:hypothetical protein
MPEMIRNVVLWCISSLVENALVLAGLFKVAVILRETRQDRYTKIARREATVIAGYNILSLDCYR